MSVKKVQNVYYVTADMDRAVAFYRDALGLDLAFRDGARWAQMKAGESNFALSSADEGAPGAVGATAVLEVDDIAAARAQAEAHGAEILEQREMGSGTALTLRDPDGNLVQLYRRGG